MNFLTNEEREKIALLIESLAKDRERIFEGLSDREISLYNKLLWSFTRLLEMQLGEGCITKYRNKAARCLEFPKTKGLSIDDKMKVELLESFITRIGDYLFCITRDLVCKKLRED